MIDIFAALNYTEEKQVNFTVFQFERPGRTWWNIIRTKWEREWTVWTWLNFVREFNKKYLPPIVQEKRNDDFIKLRQGGLSASEYETQFTKLSKFAPKLIVMEQRRVRRFVQGLNVEIQEALAAAQINTFTEVLEKTQRIEIARAQVNTFHARKKGASSGDQGQEQGGQGMPPRKVSRGAGGVKISGTSTEVISRGVPGGKEQLRGASQGDQTSILYGYCGKTNHTEDNCWRKALKCLWCGSAEGQIATCPLSLNPKQPNVGGNKFIVPARAYTLNHQPVLNPSKVVEGKIRVFHCLAKFWLMMRSGN
ncbi:uncharacterized protein LOC113769232 [Coffea eugenioides]|uniref:uncharacterized protein LOC113769232 n=1 Tax=Coffea eugenioides TaxID=49369 RepID=UPI000F60C994|nr:uncharacterized protein LOC113769232 [Coffea eugenioides]